MASSQFWCILGGILCDLELQESKQETRYRPGKSRDAGSPTLATRPHFKPCVAVYLGHILGKGEACASFAADKSQRSILPKSAELTWLFSPRAELCVFLRDYPVQDVCPLNHGRP